MPSKTLKITTPNGQVYTASSKEEIELLYNTLADDPNIDLTKLKTETIDPVSNEVTMKDRLLGALGMGTAGAIGGGVVGGGVPGAALGGGVGASLGFAFPPMTKGEWAAGTLGSLFGGAIGKGVGTVASKAPAMLGPVIRGGAGLAEAEAGKMLQTGIDTDKPQGFNPISPEGITSMLLPNVGNAWKNVGEASPGVISARLKRAIPGLLDQLTNKNLSKQATASPYNALAPFAFDKAKPLAKTAQEGIRTTTLEPLENIITGLESQKTTLEDQLKSFTANSATGPFAKTQQYLQRDILLKQLDEVNDKLNDIIIRRAQARQAAVANSIAKERVSKETQGGLKDTQIDKSADQLKNQLSKEQWKQDYLTEQRKILLNKKMNRAQKADALKLLDNKYKQIYSSFDESIKSFEIDKKLVDKELNAFKRQYTAADRNLQINKKYQAGLNTEEKKLKTEQTKAKTEIAKINQEEADFYKKQKEITGVDLQKVQNEIKTVQEQLNSLSVLPPNIKKIVQSGENIDEFVQIVRSMRPDEYSDFIKYIPQAQQKAFNEAMGDAIVFDFFVKSIDPKTNQFSNMQNYLAKYGLPNIEQFYGVPGGQEKFAKLADRLIKAVPQGNNRTTSDYVRSYLTGAAIRGAAYQGIYMLFGASQFHGGALLKTAATGIAALAIATPVLIRTALRNERLANDFIRFIDSGGTLTYAQVPYLATFIKNESKPITENELTDIVEYLKELAVTNESAPAPQQNQQPQQPPINQGSEGVGFPPPASQEQLVSPPNQ
jgi:hypothetical protein